MQHYIFVADFTCTKSFPFLSNLNAPKALAAESLPQTPLVRSLQQSIDFLRGGVEIFFKPQLPDYTIARYAIDFN